MRKIKVSKEKIGLVLGVAVVVTNPFTNQFVIDGIVRGLMYLSRESGAYVTLVAAAYFIGLMLFGMWKSRDITKVPTKAHKAPKQAYLEI